MSVGTKIGVFFVLGLVLLAIVGGAFYVSTQRMLDAERSVDHTRVVEKTLDDLLLAHVDAETGQRGFIITGEDAYLEPYQAGIRHVQQDLDAVENLTRDNPSQQETLRQVRKLSEAKLAELQKTIQLEKESGFQRRLARGPHRPRQEDHG